MSVSILLRYYSVPTQCPGAQWTVAAGSPLADSPTGDTFHDSRSFGHHTETRPQIHETGTDHTHNDTQSTAPAQIALTEISLNSPRMGDIGQ